MRLYIIAVYEQGHALWDFVCLSLDASMHTHDPILKMSVLVGSVGITDCDVERVYIV